MDIGPDVDLEYLGGDPSDARSEIEQCMLAAKTPERSTREWDWLIMMSWANGQPWYWRDRTEGRAKRVWTTEDQRTRPILMNLIAPRVDTLVGTEAFVPRYIGRNTAQLGTEDHMKVRAVGDVANHAVGVTRLGTKKTDTDLIKHTLGLAWMKTDWDPTAGTYVESWDEFPCPTCQGNAVVPGADGEPVPCITCSAEGAIASSMQAEFRPGFTSVPMGSKPEGEVSVTVHPPWEIYADPSAPDPKKPRRLVHEYLVDKDAAWLHWLADSGLPSDKMQTGGASELVYMLTAGWNQGMYAEPSNLVTVREFFCLPSERWPDGLHVVEVGGVMVRGERLPAHRRIPYVPFRGYTRIGRYFPTSTVERLLPVQYAHHVLSWCVQDHAEFAAQMRIIKPKGVGFQMDDQPGVVSYTQQPGTAAPQFFKDAGIPPDVFNQLDRLERQADEVSYAAPLMRGQSAGESSARHDAWLEQRQMQPMKRMLEDNADSLKIMGELLVDTIKEYYDPGRQLRDVFGSGGQMLMREFDANRMGSSANVELIPERDVGRTLSSRREELINLYKSGIAADPKWMRLAEIAGQDEPFAEDATDQQVALHEDKQVRRWDMETNPPQIQPAGVDPMTGQPTEAYLMNSPMDPPFMGENFDAHRPVHMMTFNQFKMAHGMSDPRTMAIKQHLELMDELQAQQQARLQGLATQEAAKYGLGNAADGSAQPAATQESATAMGAAADPTGGTPGEPETQQSLAQVDQGMPR